MLRSYDSKPRSCDSMPRSCNSKARSCKSMTGSYNSKSRSCNSRAGNRNSEGRNCNSGRRSSGYPAINRAGIVVALQVGSVLKRLTLSRREIVQVIQHVARQVCLVSFRAEPSDFLTVLHPDINETCPQVNGEASLLLVAVVCAADLDREEIADLLDGSLNSVFSRQQIEISAA